MTDGNSSKRDTAEPPPPNPRRLLIAAFIGVALFCVTGLIVFHLEDLLIFYAFVGTPLFGLPLAVELWRQKQIRWLGGAFFILGLMLAHFAAIRVADTIYHEGVAYWGECGMADIAAHGDPRPQNECVRHAAATRAHNAPRAGLAGGLAGAALSYGGLLLLGRRFRSGRALAAMTVATMVLGAIGAAGMSFAFPDYMRASEWVLQIFLPWQSVFALSLVYLFGTPGSVRK